VRTPAFPYRSTSNTNPANMAKMRGFRRLSKVTIFIIQPPNFTNHPSPPHDVLPPNPHPRGARQPGAYLTLQAQPPMSLVVVPSWAAELARALMQILHKGLETESLPHWLASCPFGCAGALTAGRVRGPKGSSNDGIDQHTPILRSLDLGREGSRMGNL